MKIAKVQIINTLGIQELEFTAAGWNEITGGNGTGKTSVLEAIKSVFQGGNDATLIRKGEERGEVVLILDDGTQLRRRQTAKTAALTVEKDGQRFDKPQQTVNGWLDQLSINPVEFLRAPPKKRASILLETMPIQADPERIRSIIGQADFEVAEGHAIDVIKAAYDEVFAQRRETNRVVREKEASINQLAETLPDASEVPAGDESELEAQIAALDEAKNAEDLRIDGKLGALKVEFEGRVDALREDIAALEAQIAEKRNAILAEREAFANTQQRADLQRTTKTAQWRESRQPLVDALNLIRANRDAAVRADNTRATMRKMREEANTLEADSKRQTRTLEQLEAYRMELLSNLPIPGLEVVDGELMRGGVPFDRLNKAQQAEIAIEIAKARAGDLKVVCVDEFEALDAEHREHIIRLAEEAGLQFFVTRVNDQGGELTINAQ